MHVFNCFIVINIHNTESCEHKEQHLVHNIHWRYFENVLCSVVPCRFLVTLSAHWIGFVPVYCEILVENQWNSAKYVFFRNLCMSKMSYGYEIWRRS
jgi:hypothetical protein